MAEILGVGVTHYPPMLVADEEKAFPINITLARDERVPERMKNPANWPEPMRVEYGEDEGLHCGCAAPGTVGEKFPGNQQRDSGIRS